MRRAARKDSNHNEVAQHLKAKGWSVLDLSGVGNGCPDLLVAKRSFAALVELKDGAKSPSKRELNDFQVRFKQKWNGVCIKAESAEDAEKQLALAESYQYLRQRSE